MKDKLKRRELLKAVGATGIGLGAVAACNQVPVVAVDPGHNSMPANAPSAQATETADEMDKHHEQGVKSFLDNIEVNSKTFWPAKLPFKMDGDTKVFELTCQELSWETSPGDKFSALSYNGVVPGPEIRVTEGDKVRVNVKNQMGESTSIHWHGLILPNSMDGVPYITQPPIKPGASFTYEFVARNQGSHMYHSHHNSAEQVTRGLLGAFIIDPKEKKYKYDSDYVMILNDTKLGFTINGKGFPATAPILAKKDEIVRVRFMNEGLMIHPMHLHGMPMQVVEQDGWPQPQPYTCDTLNIAPGQRFDVLINCTEPGAWAFHCHILNHAESRMGMFGMVTALVIK